MIPADRTTTSSCLALLWLLIAPGPALAEDSFFYPRLSTETVLQLQYDRARASDGTTTRNLTFSGEHLSIVDFSRNLSFNSLISMQQLNDPNPGSNFFQYEGLYLEEAYMKWTEQVWTFRTGEFSQNFGRAWFLVPGLYGADFVSDYQLSEKLGVEAAYAFGHEYGRHQLSIADFVADRTFLSQSLFYNRGQVSLADGGPTNTQAPRSYVLSYDGRNVPLGWGTLSYQLSSAFLGRGENDTGTENRVGTGFNINVPINSSVMETLSGRFSEVRLIGEAVRRWNADGIADKTMDYLTGATELVYDNWVFDLSATSRKTTLAGDATRDTLLQSTVGYNFPFDTKLSLGIGREDVDGVRSTIVGAQLSYTLTTCDRCEIMAKKH